MGNKFSTDTESEDTEKELWPYLCAMRDPSCLDWKRGLSDEEIQICALRQIDLPVPITSSLYLSDHKGVCDVDKLKSLGITRVLNVAGPAARGPLKMYETNDILYKEIDADDEEGYDMLGKHLEECQIFVHSPPSLSSSSVNSGEGGQFQKQEDQNESKTVIHCVAGINRSGVVAAAIHMLEEAQAQAEAQTHSPLAQTEIETETPGASTSSSSSSSGVSASGVPSASVSVLNTVAHCRRQRSNCFLWNHSFQLQLAQLARKHGLLGALPGEPGCCCESTASPPAPAPRRVQSGAGRRKTPGVIKDLF